MPFPQQQFPYFILQLDVKGAILKVHHFTDGLLDVDAEDNHFSNLIEFSSSEKSLHFFDKIITEGAALDWELGFKLNENTEVMTASGFKTDNSIYIIAIGRTIGTQVMYEEMTLINNEQLNSIRMLRKQLNQMAIEYNLIREEMNKEIERLREELNKCKASLTA